MWEGYLQYIPEQLQRAFWGGRLFYVFLAALVYLWIFEKSKRRVLVYPSLLLLAVLFNPWLCWYIWRPIMNDYAFARLLWMLPMLVVVASAAVSVIGKIRKKWLKAVVLAIVCVLATQSGQYIYINTGSGSTGFVKAENPYHLPEIVVRTADYLLEKNSIPRAVLDMSLTPYIRQYSSSIQQFSGRYLNMSGGIRKEMADMLMQEPPDLDWIRKQMIKNYYEYLVLPEDLRGAGYYESKGFQLLDVIEAADGSRYVYKLKYDFPMEAKDGKNQHVGIPVYMYSGKTYRISAEEVLVTDGESDAVTVLLYDKEGEEVIDQKTVGLENGKTEDMAVEFTIPDDDSYRNRYQVMLYSGEYGHTKNIGVTYSDVNVEEIK